MKVTTEQDIGLCLVVLIYSDWHECGVRNCVRGCGG